MESPVAVAPSLAASGVALAPTAGGRHGLWSTSTPPPPGAEEARRLLEEELRDPAYLRSWWDLFLQWVQSLLAVPAGGRDLAPLLGPALVAVGLALVALLTWAVLRHRRPRPESTSPRVPFAAGEILDAEEHRARARAHLAAGRWSEAAVEAFRASTAAGLARGQVRDTPDLTAHEAGRALAGHHPAHREEIRWADRTFAAVRYGDVSATEDQARRLLALDAALEEATAGASEATPSAPARPGTSAPPTPPSAYPVDPHHPPIRPRPGTGVSP